MNKKAVIGCGLVLGAVLIALVGVLAIFGPKVFTFARGVVEGFMEDNARRAAWVAPAADATGETLFPLFVGGFERESFGAFGSLPRFGIERAGEQGRYRDRNGAAVEVHVWQAPDSGRDDLFEAIDATLDKGNYTLRKIVTLNGASKRFTFSPPRTSGRMWANKGWIFLVAAENEADAEHFEIAYLSAVEGGGIPDTQPSPAPNGLPAPLSTDENK